jgi:tRNA-splicing endonuclease subunit Sen34
MTNARDGGDDESRARASLPVVRVVDGRALVYDADDAVTLRVERRVVGAMVGALPGYRSQDAAKGLPLELCAEEAALCAERGWARLTGERDGSMEAFVAHRTSVDGDVRVVSTSNAVREEAKARAKAKRQSRGWGGGGGGHKKAKAKPGAANVVGWQKTMSGTSYVSLPLQNRSDGDAARAGWTFPSTRAEKERYAVFKDLHDKAFYLTSGTKFGSDFLAYPGDPILFHAHYTVRIVSWDRVMHPLMISASTRMSHAARKNFVVAAVRAADESEQNFEVHYFTLEADVDLSSNRGY